MAIRIVVSTSIPLEAVRRIEALMSLLQETDVNFVAVPIKVARSEEVERFAVHDAEDEMRGALLHDLVKEALKADSEWILGNLR
ncbi:MAG: hypothetical protein EON54_15435 [Alcaligenaceae bacterium]|nr:MAG: hypothetical protein EON54_15435 [Alcaligenaceae bacterium]